jgi:hypothetical protein
MNALRTSDHPQPSKQACDLVHGAYDLHGLRQLVENQG